MYRFWLAFTRVNGLGPIRLRQLRSHFDSIEDAWNAPAERLRALGVPRSSVEHLIALRKSLRLEEFDKVVAGSNARVLTLDDEDYPALLRELEDAPPFLFVQGNLLPEDQFAVALVGTRRASEYGKLMATQLTEALVQENVTIVSGLAHGIDAAAHRAALKSGGRTLAVLGNGIDVVYPPEHRDLARQIAEAGALISEFLPGTRPERGNFPIRNRVISGMTLGTVVVEAPEGSGSLQTANLAAEQGREVFAIPGNANSPNARGTNRLIQDGAKLVLSAEDILRELNIQHRNVETRQQVKKVAPSSPLEEQIVQLLARNPLHVDELSRICALSVQEVNTMLVLMELKGLVYQTAPMTYHITETVEIPHGS